MADPPRSPDSSAEKSDLRVGTILAERYRLDRLLGVGGMGRVYAAEHVLMRKRLAVKVLHRELTRVPEVVARFEREAMAAANIDHPNVAAATDFGKLPDGAVFLVLEYVSGRSLRDEIAAGPMAPERALHIAGQIASALAAAHALDIVHRDLKPENVMLVEKGNDRDFVKVLDFGIAKVPIDETSERGSLRPDHKITKAGMVFGTPEYMAPEQALGQTVDGRADLYGLGVILFELLAGVRPYSSATQVGILGQQLSLPVPRVADRARGVAIPRDVEVLLQTLLARETFERYESAAQVVELIEQLRGAAPARVRQLFTLPRGSVSLSSSPESVVLNRAARMADSEGLSQAGVLDGRPALDASAAAPVQRAPLPSRLLRPPVPPPAFRASAPLPPPPPPSRTANADGRSALASRRDGAPGSGVESSPAALLASESEPPSGTGNADEPEDLGDVMSDNDSEAELRTVPGTVGTPPRPATRGELGLIQPAPPADEPRHGLGNALIAAWKAVRGLFRGRARLDAQGVLTRDADGTATKPKRALAAVRSALVGVPQAAVIAGLVLFVAASVTGLLFVSSLWSDPEPSPAPSARAMPRQTAVPAKPMPTSAPAPELAEAKNSGTAALRALAEQYPRDARILLEFAKSLRRDELFGEVAEALAHALALDEKLNANGEVATLLWQTAQKSESRAQAFALLEDSMGARGTDIAYDLVVTDGIQPVVRQRAEQLLRGDPFDRHATEALKVAVALRAAKDCASQRKLVSRAHRSGDRRSLPYLQAMQQGECLAGDQKSVSAAIDAIQRRARG